MQREFFISQKVEIVFVITESICVSCVDNDKD